MITADELRKKFLDFFLAKGHKIIPSASLVPDETDPTVLFTTAGMHPLAPYLMGEKHLKGKRLVNIQKCLRTGDIEDVGDSSHNTFFEMLGNWSLGDYFKEDSIRWSWEFLTDKKWLGISPEKIKVTVFEGDDNAPRDDESIKIWQECFKKAGISSEVYDKEKGNNETARIFPLPKKDNWWGPAGETGPCGPDTEIFIDLGKPVNSEKCSNGDECKPGCECGRYVEVWNNVFMEFNKISDGKYVPLKQRNVDTGMGLERMLAVLNGLNNVYETELFSPVIKRMQSLEERTLTPTLSQRERGNRKSYRIIADHIKAGVFIISDGVVPSNVGRGYVLRRLIRRAVRHGKILGIEKNFTKQIAESVIDIYKKTYPEVEENKEKIFEELEKEEEKFKKTLEKGLKEFRRILRVLSSLGDLKSQRIISGKTAFNLFQTYGFPLELTREIARERKIKVDEQGFEEELKKHQEKSRTASMGKFKGGLADGGEEVKKLHTATHLLSAALRKVLGDHIFQKGSNITAERLRFDFSHPEKLTDEQKKKVEDLVNEIIKKDLPVSFEEVNLNEAKKMGAIGVFEAKYGDKVKVYTIGGEENIFSQEICGGPHARRTGELGHFKIKKEQSSGAGVRRIKAVLK